ncbi:MAG: histidinol-phosphate transaminase [Eubacteriales bacterium]
MSRFLNARFSSLEAYTPGEQPTDMKYIKLNTNESPFPPSEGVIAALDRSAAENLRLYPDPECTELKRALALEYGTKPANVFVSNGSDEILNFAFMSFFDDGVVFPDITYGFYRVYADLYSLKYREIPLDGDFRIRTEDYIGTKSNIVLANPNAPTGIALPVSEIERIVASNPEHIVLVDEAYVDFGAESCVPLTEKYKNLIVCATYSKSRSMAGARLGFAIADAALIADLEKIRFSTNPYNINRLTLAAGAAALRDAEYYRKNCRIIEENREYTADGLRGLGFSVLPSSANFIFASSPDIGGTELYLKLRERGILVRHFTLDRIKEYNRITIGTARQMETFLREVKNIIGGER